MQGARMKVDLAAELSGETTLNPLPAISSSGETCPPPGITAKIVR